MIGIHSVALGIQGLVGTVMAAFGGLKIAGAESQVSDFD